MRFLLIIFFTLSCVTLKAQDWVYKIGNWNQPVDLLKNCVVEWNNHYLIGNMTNNQGFNISIVNKKAQLVKNIFIKSKEYQSVTLWNLSVVDNHLLASGSLSNPSKSDLEEGFFFELDSCFRVSNYTKLTTSNFNDSWSRVLGFLKFNSIKKIFYYTFTSKVFGSKNGVLVIEKNSQSKQFYLQNDIETIFMENGSIYFAGSNYKNIPFVKDLALLKGYWGSCDSNLNSLKYSHYYPNDSNSVSMIFAMKKLTSKKAVICISDRSIQSKPNVECVGTIATVDLQSNKIEKEIKYFTDTSKTEVPYSQLVTSDRKLISVTGAGLNIYYPSYGYIHDENFNLILKKRITNLFTGPIYSFWDRDSNIVLYSIYHNSVPNALVMKFDKQLNPIQIDTTLTSLPICDSIPLSILLENPVNLNVKFDTSYIIQSQYTDIAPMSRNKIQIYPNPVNEYLTIEQTEEKDLAVDIIDNLGQLIVKEIKINNALTSINMIGIKKGLYFFVIKDEMGRQIHWKMIVKI